MSDENQSDLPREKDRSPAGDDEPYYSVSEFTLDLLDEIRADRYRPHAWLQLISRSWTRSVQDVKESPARSTSFRFWAIVIGTSGALLLLLDGVFNSSHSALVALAFWLPWYCLSVLFVFTHLGMADDEQGKPLAGFFLPNGLSFMRLALAPLVLFPGLHQPAHPVTGVIFCLFIAAMSASDLLDGWIARRKKICTRLGNMLDSLADLALLTFMAVGLHMAGAIPATLLLLLLIRYPILLLGVLILYFVRGPQPLKPTHIGRITTFAANIFLLVLACQLLTGIELMTASWTDVFVWSLLFLIIANIQYLIFRAFRWPDSNTVLARSPKRGL